VASSWILFFSLPLFFLHVALLFRNMAAVCIETTAFTSTMMLVTPEGRLGYNNQLNAEVSVNLLAPVLFF